MSCSCHASGMVVVCDFACFKFPVIFDLFTRVCSANDHSPGVSAFLRRLDFVPVSDIIDNLYLILFPDHDRWVDG